MGRGLGTILHCSQDPTPAASSLASVHKGELCTRQCGDVNAALRPNRTWAPAPMCHPPAEAPHQGLMADFWGCICPCPSGAIDQSQEATQG